MIKRLGTGWVTALSTLLTAAALLGFSMTRHPAWLFLLSAPLGFGAGAVDTALVVIRAPLQGLYATL